MHGKADMIFPFTMKRGFSIIILFRHAEVFRISQKQAEKNSDPET